MGVELSKEVQRLNRAGLLTPKHWESVPAYDHQAHDSSDTTNLWSNYNGHISRADNTKGDNKGENNFWGCIFANLPTILIFSIF